MRERERERENPIFLFFLNTSIIIINTNKIIIYE